MTQSKIDDDVNDSESDLDKTANNKMPATSNDPGAAGADAEMQD